MEGVYPKTAHDIERSTKERLSLHSPHLFERQHGVDPDMVWRRIGVIRLPEDRPRAFLRYAPSDVVVEERWRDGGHASVRVSRSVPDPYGSGAYLHGHLVKQGISTERAVERMAEALGVPRASIVHAGSKDARALTAQRVSVAHLKWNRVGPVRFPGGVFEPRAYEASHVHGGDLVLHTWKILLRHDGTDLARDEERLIRQMDQDGVLNWAPPRLFGARTFDHKFGCLVLRGDLSGALRAWMGESGGEDIPLYRHYRSRLLARFPNWSAMQEVVNELPVTFAKERRVLESLLGRETVGMQSFGVIRDEVTRWVDAYGAWVWNRWLSKGGRADLDGVRRVWNEDVFAPVIAEDGIVREEAERTLRRMGVTPRSPLMSPRIWPEVHTVSQTDVGVWITMTLPKAVRPESVLASSFILHEGRPVPGWVRTS